MICDTLQHLVRYRGLHPNLDTAIDYLLTHDLAALPLGRTEVDGDKVFINLMDATLHPDAGYHPEYHKLYADLQIDLTGSEGWGYTNLPGAEIGEFTGDCGFQDSASVVTGALGEGRFVLFFPDDKCDVVVIDSATAQKYVADNDGLKIVEDNDAFDSEEYAIAVQKGNTELLDKINTAIEKLISDGKVSEYAAKYTDADAE